MYLHKSTPQIVHKDVKSANVLVANNFVPKLADYGLTASRMAGVNGTPFWMAPELFVQVRLGGRWEIPVAMEMKLGGVLYLLSKIFAVLWVPCLKAADPHPLVDNWPGTGSCAKPVVGRVLVWRDDVRDFCSQGTLPGRRSAVHVDARAVREGAGPATPVSCGAAQPGAGSDCCVLAHGPRASAQLPRDQSPRRGAAPEQGGRRLRCACWLRLSARGGVDCWGVLVPSLNEVRPAH